MKLTTIVTPAGRVPAALLSDGILVDLAVASAAGLIDGRAVRDVVEILDLDGDLRVPVTRFVERVEAGKGDFRGRLQGLGALVADADAIYAAPLRPRLILANGMAYKAHMTEMGVPLPKEPSAFIKAPGSIAGHREALRLPKTDPDMVDFECEFSCVIGRSFTNASPDEVMQHVAGYTMANDLGSRTHVAAWMESLKGDNPLAATALNKKVQFGKQFPGFCPLGPVVATADSFGDPNDVTIGTRLNGEVMQQAHSSDLIFPLAQTLSYFSQWFRFEPGDVMTTGSPAGVGYAQTPPRFLKSGDVVEVWARDVGTLATPVL